jgi:hypothetical protein
MLRNIKGFLTFISIKRGFTPFMITMGTAFLMAKKTPLKGRGRPRLTYSLPPKLHHQASRPLSDPFAETFALPFQKLKQLRRFEKDGYSKKIKRRCEAKNEVKNSLH